MLTGGVDKSGVLAATADGEPRGAVEQLKAKLFWRDDASEAAWCEKTGLSLLTFACASDDLLAVKALLASDAGNAMLGSRGKTLKHTDKLPFNTLLRNLAKVLTLALALTLAL